LLSPDGIQAIFFDLDGTLRHNLPSGGEVAADYAAQLGLHISHEDRLRAMRWEHYYWAKSIDLKPIDKLIQKRTWNSGKTIAAVSWWRLAHRMDGLKSLLPKFPSIWMIHIDRKVLCLKMCFNFCRPFKRQVTEWP
jgi:phosphoglycolate phosphatase-like HAD superfamily hydrolase